VPFDEELVLEYAVVIQRLAEGGGELLLLGVAVDEKLDDGLEEMDLLHVFVCADERGEDRLELVPVLHDVAVRAENAAQADVQLVLGRDVELELSLAHLLEDVRRVDVTHLGLFLSHENLEFFARVNYIEKTG
jgi:hypothetical protein